MADYSHGANKYNSVPRKVFDKFIDKVEIKRQRDRLDHRNDMEILLRKIKHLDEQLFLLEKHVAQHCQILDKGSDRKHGTEELE